MDIAIVGLPLSGKTTAFNALTGGHGSASADGRGESIGTVKVPDDRLQRLAELVHAKKITPIEVRLHDLPPVLVKGAAPSGEAAETLARADALIHVVRAFERVDVPHPSGSVDAKRDIATFDSEMMLSDLGIIERRLEKLDTTVRSGRPGEREAGEREQVLLNRVKAVLESDKPLRDAITDAADVKALANYGLLSLKPLLILVNVGENDAGRSNEIGAEFDAPNGEGAHTRAGALCAKLEAELTELSAEDAAEFRAELDAGDEGATDRVLALLQQLMGYITFFTAGEKDTRAWTLQQGGTALQAAGRIHTDIERGFIRAEVIDWDKLLEHGSHAEARKHGQLRTEGKTYVVQDGDVINVLFNV